MTVASPLRLNSEQGRPQCLDWFLLGLLTGAGIITILLIPRLRAAQAASHEAKEAEHCLALELTAAAHRHQAERLQAVRDTEHVARLADEREAAHKRQLAQLRAATAEKIALVAGNREQFAKQMKASTARRWRPSRRCLTTARPIATPTTLIALLHAAYHGWRQEKIAASAREIAAASRELHKRFATFLELHDKVGRQLNSAVNAYNQGAGSLEARVLPQLRRLEEAGAGSEKALPALATLETPAKLIVAGDRDPEDAARPSAEAA